MIIQENILKQVQYLRECQEQRRLDAISAAETQSDYEKAEAIASGHLIDDVAADSNGNEVHFTNDILRKAYLKNRTVDAKIAWNIAKVNYESSSAKVEIERSVLSAIKDLVGDDQLDMNWLGQYDI